MHSNFITPPDSIDTILIIDASQEQIQEVANYVQTCDTSYNIYLYSNDMNDLDWINVVAAKADVEAPQDKPATKKATAKKSSAKKIKE